MVNQFTTILLFFITSKYFSKELFGLFNWLTALFVTISSLLSFGIEQMIVKLVAESKSALVSKIYLFHLSLAALLLFLGTFVWYWTHNETSFLLFYFAFWCISNLFSVALRNSLTGFEMFTVISRIAVFSGMVRLSGILLFILVSAKTLELLLAILTASLVTEIFMSWMVLRRQPGWQGSKWHTADYMKLIHKASPQLIVAVFGVALARFDWIYIGIASPADVTADYTFAYKMFEFAKLPILVISPVLLPLFTRIMSGTGGRDHIYKENLSQLYGAELVLACMACVVFACLWTPMLELFFGDKYGSSNYLVFCVLSLAVPLQYTTDYYWNLTFSQGMFRLNMWISVITAVSNILLVVLLTPLMSATGTALAFTLSYVLPLLIYRGTQRHSPYKTKASGLVLVTCLILCSYFLIHLANHRLVITIFIPLACAAVLYKSGLVEIRKIKAIFLK